MTETGSSPERGLPGATMAVAGWLVVLSAFTILGSDLMWVVALGDRIRADGWPLDGIPFAAAPQNGWHNPIAAAQLLLSVVNSAGPAALAVLQLVVVGAALLLLVVDGRRHGAGEGRIAVVVSLVVIGCASALVITRLPSLSLVPFVLVIMLMRRQEEAPGRMVWWLVPVFIAWGNLHGGVLVGLALLGVWLVLGKGAGSVARRLGLGFGSFMALLVTSAGPNTPAYYVSALGNEAARRGTDLWARPDLRHPLDAALIAVALVLLVMAARRRMPMWEWFAVVGLVAGTVSAGRNGVWLVLFLAPAALRMHPAGAFGWQRPTLARVVSVGSLALALVAAGGILAARGPSQVGAPGMSVAALTRDLSNGRPVLADEPLAETLAQQGLTVWASNPIDAFPREVQGAYLDFLHDGTVPNDAAVDLVVAKTGTADRLAGSGGWLEVARVPGYVVLERR